MTPILQRINNKISSYQRQITFSFHHRTDRKAQARKKWLDRRILIDSKESTGQFEKNMLVSTTTDSKITWYFGGASTAICSRRPERTTAVCAAGASWSMIITVHGSATASDITTIKFSYNFWFIRRQGIYLCLVLWDCFLLTWSK